jgi:hypothetical protein
MARPSALAVLRLMTSSIFVTCCTGRSAGFSPLRMRPGIDASLVPKIGEAAAIAQQAAGQGEVTGLVDRGQRMAGCQCGKLFRAPVEVSTVADQDRTNVLLRKYRNPENRSETWSGRGLPPRWMAAALIKTGKRKEDFLIAKQAAASASKKTQNIQKARK